MIIVYCWCGNLELGWLGSLGYILFQSNWSLKQTSEISQECVIDARMLKCTFPSLPPPQDGSTTVGGREGDWGVREQSVIKRLRGVFFFFCLILRWNKKALKGLEEEIPFSDFLVKSFHLENKSYSWRSRQQAFHNDYSSPLPARAFHERFCFKINVKPW